MVSEFVPGFRTRDTGVGDMELTGTPIRESCPANRRYGGSRQLDPAPKFGAFTGSLARAPE